MNILFFVAHDKLSVKFKEIAEGSKKLSKFVLHYQFIFKKDKIKNSFSIQSGTSNESNVSLDAIRRQKTGSFKKEFTQSDSRPYTIYFIGVTVLVNVLQRD
ncbi:unnamed protein product [Rhizophagus irregularis]|uniref:Uncharacterized protein n=1 Tax=Rhizophagus irregularis TaxID=588596 RepID=A0A915ZAB9_9GLOM|nr:unnamed protein product [Rhizophagus irregularis]